MATEEDVVMIVVTDRKFLKISFSFILLLFVIAAIGYLYEGTREFSSHQITFYSGDTQKVDIVGWYKVATMKLKEWESLSDEKKARIHKALASQAGWFDEGQDCQRLVVHYHFDKEDVIFYFRCIVGEM